ncbi:MAG TPA: hypothetical protein DE147_03000 [Gammaproteobacteria bacterium]|nr:hypothetical protein [Gammaproteobacteria bacterium]
MGFGNDKVFRARFKLIISEMAAFGIYALLNQLLSIIKFLIALNGWLDFDHMSAEDIFRLKLMFLPTHTSSDLRLK